MSNVTFKNRPYSGNCQDGSSTIQLATVDPAQFVNMYVSTAAQRVMVCMHADMAKEVRDELNRLYPVEAPKATVEAPKRKAPKGAQAYKGNGKHEWEYVCSDIALHTRRLRVPGGWLYRTLVGSDMAIAFVPVPEVVGYSV